MIERKKCKCGQYMIRLRDRYICPNCGHQEEAK